MGLLHPELLLLALPVALVWWKTRGEHRVTLALRLLVAVLLLLALAGPYSKTSAPGRDLVILVDRSRSMPDGSEASALELVRLAEEERGEGDRVAIVGFGGEVRIERPPSAVDRFQGFDRDVEPDGSDLAAGLEVALNLIPEGREGSILVLSDGESNAADPVAGARRAFGRGVRIDVRVLPRPDTADLSVERVDLPGSIAVGEPFQFNVWIRSDRRVESEFTLRRGDRVLSSGRRFFEPGVNRLVFRDVLERPGVSEYQVELAGQADRVPENDRGLGAVLATGAAALLVISGDGGEDSLVRALRQARIPVATSTPELVRLDAVGLSGFRAVIVENVAASRMARGLPALRDFVVDRGGGLFLTGGQASFGIGGYYLSPIDEILPVSMELRQEHRKMAVALAITMDRSGSMQASVGGGMRKMDLANLGAAAAIELLSPIDSVAVIAVDSAYHIIQELTPVTDVAELTSKVRRIDSMGGGIFTYTALLAAGKELEGAEQINRHITLFADAADAEEQEKCPELVAQLERMGVTLSVIALGSEADRDASFLKTIAGLGGGEAYFTNDPKELPRLFAMDTLTAARSTFVDEPAAVTVLPDLFGMAALPADSFPNLAGYNLNYLKPNAQAGMVTADEYHAPIFAFWQQGLGRTAAYSGQIGGTYGADVARWEGFAPFFVTVARWLLGQEEPEEFFTSVRREGKSAVLSVEVDPDAPLPPDTARLQARLVGAGGEKTELTLERTGEHVFEARTPLAKEGVTLGTVVLGEDRFVSLPPLVLPYSPEFERSPDPDRGARLLRRLARESGGEVGVAASNLFRGERGGRMWRLVARELMIAALVLLLFEIAGRRLGLWGSWRMPPAITNTGRRLVGAAGRLRRPRPAAAPGPAAARSDDAPEAGSDTAPTPAPVAPPRAEPTGVSSALSRARRAADRKLDR